MIKRLVDYQWSSNKDYAYASQSKNKPVWLNTDFIFSNFETKDPHSSYRRNT